MFHSSQVVVWDFLHQQYGKKQLVIDYRWWWKFAPLNSENSIVLLKPIWTKIIFFEQGSPPPTFQVEKSILKARDTSLEESKRDRAGWILDGQESRILQNNSVLRWISLWIRTVHYSLVCWNKLNEIPNLPFFPTPATSNYKTFTLKDFLLHVITCHGLNVIWKIF